MRFYAKNKPFVSSLYLTGYLGPGGLFDDNQVDGVDCIGGAAGYIDRKLFGVSHIYGNPTAKSVYGQDMIGPYDPEGFLGEHTNVMLSL